MRSKNAAAKNTEPPKKPANYVDPFVLVYCQEDNSFMYFNIITELRKKQVKTHESNEALLYVKFNKNWFLGKIINRAGNQGYL